MPSSSTLAPSKTATTKPARRSMTFSGQTETTDISSPLTLRTSLTSLTPGATSPIPSADGSLTPIASPIDIKNVRPKVGSRENIRYCPAGSTRKIESNPLPRFDNVQSKVGSRDNIKHKPTNSNRKIFDEKLNFNEGVQPKVPTKVHKRKSIPALSESKSSPTPDTQSPARSAAMRMSKSVRKFSANIHPTQKLDFSNVKSRVGSMDNIKHKPRRETRPPIFSEKLTFREQAKPKIPLSQPISDKESTHSGSSGEKRRSPHVIPPSRLDWSHVSSRVGSKDNLKHKARGGDIQIFHERLHWEAEPKVPINERRSARRRAKLLAAMMEELGLACSTSTPPNQVVEDFSEISAEPKEIDIRSDEGVGSGEEIEEFPIVQVTA